MNGFTFIVALILMAGIAIVAADTIYRLAFRRAYSCLSACFSEASWDYDLPIELPLCTLMAVQHPASYDMPRMSRGMSVAWAVLVLDTAAPGYKPADASLRRWYEGTKADAVRHLPMRQRTHARRWAANPIGTGTYNLEAWLDATAAPTTAREEA